MKKKLDKSIINSEKTKLKTYKKKPTKLKNMAMWQQFLRYNEDLKILLKAMRKMSFDWHTTKVKILKGLRKKKNSSIWWDTLESVNQPLCLRLTS